ncbi:aminotransferase class III-fold pyridoxal phosphate-dependent enzyme [Patescibacteria group bacterium]|nr:aminotransferase class III-fold pyridoxal phosphate-dependent enzyme [Patescibacteria group bacterium]
MTQFPGPAARNLLYKSKRYYARNTQKSRICGAKREGPFVIDKDGFRFLDLHCGAGVNSFGEFPEFLKDVVRKWMDSKIGFWEFHYGPNESAVLLAERLRESSPVSKPSVAFFSNSGAEANVAALKAFRAHHRSRGEHRKTVGLVAENAFHGRLLELLALTSSKPEVQRNPFWTEEDKKNVLQFPFPKKGATDKRWYAEIDRLLSLHAAHLSFVILEVPCQGEGGVIEIDEDALAYLYTQIKMRNIFFWVDAIQCGMGRTGTLFGCDRYEWLKPDVLTLGKALGGTFAFGVTIMRRELSYLKHGMHSNTFGGHPLTCPAALVMLDETQKLIDNGHIKRIEEFLSHRMSYLAEKYPRYLQEARGLGAMWALEFQSVAMQKKIIKLGEEACMRHEFGLSLLGCGRKAIRFMPPLNIPIDILQKGLDIFEKVMVDASK